MDIINKKIKQLTDLPLKQIVKLPLKIRLLYSKYKIEKQAAILHKNEPQTKSSIEERYIVPNRRKASQDRRQNSLPYFGIDKREYLADRRHNPI